MGSPTHPKQSHVMIDIETLSTCNNACIISIGAVLFNVKEGILDTFYRNVDAQTCKDVGLVISKDTVEWWAKQDHAAVAALMKDQKPITEVLQDFNKWLDGERIMPWGNGSSFDITIMESAFQATGVSVPWFHWDIMCFRTVMNLMGISNKDIRSAEDDIHHHALDDALSQTKTLLKILRT
tara:strand:+ start:503 stop:1045 length:543 start_codon:yes stop_codon:yes gene_type:complete